MYFQKKKCIVLCFVFSLKKEKEIVFLFPLILFVFFFLNHTLYFYFETKKFVFFFNV